MKDKTIVLNTGGGTSSTTSWNPWNSPERVAIIEYHDKIEMVYKETSMITLTIHPSPPPEVRVFKIVFSCIDGKWNKSEKIYGKIISQQKERYEFDEDES